MRKIFCDVCARDMTQQDVYGLKIFQVDERGVDAKTDLRIELCVDCRRDAKASIEAWQKNGIVTKYT